MYFNALPYYGAMLSLANTTAFPFQHPTSCIGFRSSVLFFLFCFRNEITDTSIPLRGSLIGTKGKLSRRSASVRF